MKALLITLIVLCVVLPVYHVVSYQPITIDKQLASMDWGEDMCNPFVYTPYGACGIEAMRYTAQQLVTEAGSGRLTEAGIYCLLLILVCTFVYCMVATVVAARQDQKREAAFKEAMRMSFARRNYVDSTCRHIDCALVVIRH